MFLKEGNMKKWVSLLLLLWLGTEGYTQGKGGGIYLRNDSKCIGSIVYGNQAQDGFGVGGENAALVNTTIIGNEKILQDTTRITPGYIYCADGEILDTTTYKKEGRTNAIGIVFWVRGDMHAVYPKGAVVALEESVKKWGANDVLIISDQYGGEVWQGYAFLKDTACYGNTFKMEEMYRKGWTDFEAGHYCYHYKASRQEGNLPQWCMPVYLYVRRIFSTLTAIEASLDFLKRCHPDWKIQKFSRNSESGAWYLSSDDGVSDSGDKNQVSVVNFVTGAMGKHGSIECFKGTSSNVRPVFVY